MRKVEKARGEERSGREERSAAVVLEGSSGWNLYIHTFHDATSLTNTHTHAHSMSCPTRNPAAT